MDGERRFLTGCGRRGLSAAAAGALLLLTACTGEVAEGDSGAVVEETEPAYRPTAATAPSTDVFLGRLESDDEGLRIVDLVNATDRDGYDNQPDFVPGGETMLYTSALDTMQTDIYALDLRTGASRRLTHTDDASEFSATVMPGETGFSTIHEDASSQQLWRFDMDGTSRGGLLDGLQPVGYHAWIDDHTVVAFVLGDDSTPPTLRMADSETGEQTVIVENPGRSLHHVPGTSTVSFVHKVTDTDWLIKTVDAHGTIETLTPTLPGREDYAWLPDGTIVMGMDATVYRWAPGGAWQPLADLASAGVAGISRLAVSPDGGRIAVVGDRIPPEG